MQRYTFSVVISNSLCDGYTDEKLQNAYDSGTIPLVLGSPSIRNVDFNLALGLEHPSMIYLEEFPSPKATPNPNTNPDPAPNPNPHLLPQPLPKALGQFLEVLASDEEALERYHAFRQLARRRKQRGLTDLETSSLPRDVKPRHKAGTPECFACMEASNPIKP